MHILIFILFSACLINPAPANEETGPGWSDLLVKAWTEADNGNLEAARDLAAASLSRSTDDYRPAPLSALIIMKIRLKDPSALSSENGIDRLVPLLGDSGFGILSAIASELEQAGRFEEALDLYKTALKQKDATPSIAPGRLAFNLGRLDEARSYLETYDRYCREKGRICNNSPETFRLLGSIAIIENRLDSARKLFEKLKKTSPRYYHWGMGELHRALFETEAAEKDYSKALSGAQDSGDAPLKRLVLTARLMNAIDSEKNEEIPKRLEEVRKLDDQTGDPATGYALLRTSRYDEAVAILRRIIADQPQTVDLLQSRAEVLVARYNLAVLASVRGDNRTAKEELELLYPVFEKRFGVKNPMTIRLMTSLGKLRGTGEGKDKPDDLFMKVLAATGKNSRGSVGTDNAEALRFMGHNLLRRGQPREALRYYNDAFRESTRLYGRDSDRLIALYQSMTNARKRMEDITGALVVAEKGYSLASRKFKPEDPERISFMVTYGTLLLEKGDLKRAEPLLETALEARIRHLGEKHSRVSTVLASLGRLYAARGNDQKAIETLEKALAMKNDSGHGESWGQGENHYWLATVQMKTNQKEKAEASLLKAIELLDARKDTNDRIYKDAVKRLAGLKGGAR